LLILPLLLVPCWFPLLAKSARTANAEAGSSGTGQTRRIPASGNLQEALDLAKPGDTVVLEAGAPYLGHFILPSKAGSSFITITTSALTSLPPEGVRIGPPQASYMPKLVSPDQQPALAAASGAHHYKLVGIEFHPSSGIYPYDIVTVGMGETTSEQVPHDIIFDRVYVHGDARAGAKRGIALNGASITVENSCISDIKGLGQDTQALAGWNGPGPFHILNNYLEAAGENVMFGGARIWIPGLIPSDIEIRHNHFSKPLSWKQDDPSYQGTRWQVKNLLELKNARRVVVDGNVLENSWVQAQTGYAVLFSPRTEDGRFLWVRVEDVTFTHNIIRHSVSGITIAGRDGPFEGLTKRVLIADNLLEDIQTASQRDAGNLFLIGGGVDGLRIEHNTAMFEGLAMIQCGARSTNKGFVYRNNISTSGKWGVIGANVGSGDAALDYYFPGAVFEGNALIYGGAGLYRRGNFFPGSIRHLGFVDPANGDYRLSPRSRYKGKGTDGKDLGADMAAIGAATAGVIDGKSLTSSQ
jgi:hypothetical protein